MHVNYNCKPPLVPIVSVLGTQAVDQVEHAAIGAIKAIRIMTTAPSGNLPPIERIEVRNYRMTGKNSNKIVFSTDVRRVTEYHGEQT